MHAGPWGPRRAGQGTAGQQAAGRRGNGNKAENQKPPKSIAMGQVVPVEQVKPWTAAGESVPRSCR